MDKSIRKAITVLRSTLLSWDDIIRNINDDWLLQEILMDYRLKMHGDIDTFLKLRKHMKKLSNVHLESNQLSLKAKDKGEQIKKAIDTVTNIQILRPFIS